jgi:hypothetical protein
MRLRRFDIGYQISEQLIFTEQKTPEISGVFLLKKNINKKTCYKYWKIGNATGTSLAMSEVGKR